MNKILKLTFILFLVCAITAGVLGGINELTKDKIAEVNAEKTAEAHKAVLKADSFEEVAFDSEDELFKSIDSIYKGTNGEGYVVESTFSGAQGKITMATGIGPDMKCTGISIIKHSETSGLGANAASVAEVGVNFRNQFVDEGSDIALKKAGGNIDALTGATITSSSVTEAVANAIAAVEKLS